MTQQIFKIAHFQFVSFCDFNVFGNIGLHFPLNIVKNHDGRTQKLTQAWPKFTSFYEHVSIFPYHDARCASAAEIWPILAAPMFHGIKCNSITLY
jgi:hypothetical protein